MTELDHFLSSIKETMENIPDEILEYIFHYISTYELCTVVSEVCKQWQLIIMHQVMSVKDADQLRMFHVGLRAVIVTERVWNLCAASRVITCATQMIPRLQELTICSNFPLDEEDYKSLMYIPHLKHLDVFSKRKCMDKNININASITILVVNEAMASGFLKNLNKSNKLMAFHMYGRARYYIVRQMVDFLQIQSGNLQDLTLRCQEFGDEKFKTISQCVRLVSLQLHQCSLVTKRSIAYVASLPKLRRLHLTGARLLRSSGILELINCLHPLIEDLNLSYSDFGDEHCTALALRLPRLTTLELWRCGAGRGGAGLGSVGLCGAALLRLVQEARRMRALDTDVHFDALQLQALGDHSALGKLRCRWDGPNPLVGSKLKMTSALKVYSKEYLRGDGEGPSAELYYYWTRGVDLISLFEGDQTPRTTD
ncbi:unnamed protein product, partial [Brenthis ino]